MLCYHTSVISVFKMVSQDKCHRFEAGLDYIMSARAARDAVRPCLKKTTKQQPNSIPSPLPTHSFSQPHFTQQLSEERGPADLLGTGLLGTDV